MPVRPLACPGSSAPRRCDHGLLQVTLESTYGSLRRRHARPGTAMRHRTTRTPSPRSARLARSRVATAARRRRVTRFRVTALPTGRPTANATRGGGAHREARWRSRFPASLATAVCRCPNVRRSRMRQIRPTTGVGPCADGTESRPDRPGRTSVCESRVVSTASGRWVDRYASTGDSSSGRLGPRHAVSTTDRGGRMDTSSSDPAATGRTQPVGHRSAPTLGRDRSIRKIRFVTDHPRRT